MPAPEPGAGSDACGGDPVLCRSMAPVAGDGSVLGGGRGRLFREVVDRRPRPVGRRSVDRVPVIGVGSTSCRRCPRRLVAGPHRRRHRGAGACRRPGRRPRRVSGSPGPSGGRRGLPPRPKVALIWSHHGRAVATAEPLVTISGPRTVHMRGLRFSGGLCGRFVVCLWSLAGQLETTPMEIRCLVVLSWPFCGLKETIAETLALSWSLDGLPVSVAGPVADTWWSPPGPVVAVRRP